VLVGDYGETVVIDWGLAKILGTTDRASTREINPGAPIDATVAGAVLGTPYYMPPEQAAGSEADEKADVYAIGAILYQLITGSAPFADRKAKDLSALLALVTTAAPTPVAMLEPATPPDLATIIAKAMAREPVDRYPSARELANELRRFTNGQLVQAHRYDRLTLIRRWLRRNRAAVTVAGMLLAVLAIGAAYSVRSIIDERDTARSRLSTALYQKGVGAERDKAWSRAAMYYQAARSSADSGAVRFAAGRAEARMIPPVVLHREHRQWIRGVAISGPDAITVDESGVVHRWSLATGRTLATWTAPTPLYAVAVAPDGTIAVGGDDGIVRLLDAKLVLRAERRGAGRVLSIAFSRDGAKLAAGSEDTVIRVWSGPGEPQHFKKHTQKVYSVEFSPDGSVLLSASDDRTALVWNLDGTVRNVLPTGGGGGVRAASFFPDGERVFTTGWDWTMRLWNARTGATEQTQSYGQWSDTASVHAAVLSPDGRLVVTGGDSQIVRVWDPTTQGLVANLDGHIGQITSLGISSDGEWLVSVGRDTIARVWNFHAARRLAGLGHQRNIKQLLFSADSRTLVSSSADYTVRSWDVASGRELERISPPIECQDGGFALKDGTLGFTCKDGNVYLRAAGRRERTLVGTGRRLLAAAVASDESWLAAGHDGGWMHVWDLESGRLRASRKAHDHHIYGVRTVSGGILTASLDNTVRILSPDLEQLAIWYAPKVELLDAALDPRGRFLIAGSNGPALLRWRSGEDKPVALAGHRDTIWKVGVSPDGTLAASASTDGTVLLWNTTTWESSALRGPLGVVNSIAFSPDGAMLASGHERGAVILWDVASRTQLRRLGATEADESGTCEKLDGLSWHDPREQDIVTRACSESNGFSRLANQTHLVFENDVDLVERWAE
jgi:eukaryotic-like serine/threonine-protein kinase